MRVLDSAGGVLAGALIGFAIVWVLGAMALQLPGQADLRRAVQRSYVLQQLNEIVPPRSLLNALARIDPFPSFAGPPVPTEPPDPRVAARRRAYARRRRAWCACSARRAGSGVEGSGWVAARGLVVTAAHVVAGEEDTEVVARRTDGALRAQAVAFDPHNDVAVLRVDGLDAPPLRLKDPHPGASIAIVGYPLNGPLESSAGRIGQTETVLAQDAYGEGPTRRVGHEPERDDPARQLRRAGGRRLAAPCRRPSSPPSDGRGGYGVPASVVRRDARRRRPARSRPAPACASRRASSAASGCLNGGIT